MTSWHEKNLLNKIQKGDQKSFGKVYDLHVDKIYKFIFLKISSHEFTQELVQDVFMRFWQYAQKEENIVKSIKALLYQIARNLVIDHYRTQNINIQVSIDDYSASGELATIDKIDLDIQFDMDKVQAALKLLPENYKDIIIMKFVNELSNKEIAKALDKTEGNIRVLAHRALNALKSKIQETNA